MKRIMVRYKVKPGRVEENESLVQDVFESLKKEAPVDFKYASFKGDDGLSFVHLVSMESANDDNPLQNLEAFKRFIASIGDRCDEPPVAMELSEVGSFNF